MSDSQEDHEEEATSSNDQHGSASDEDGAEKGDQVSQGNKENVTILDDSREAYQDLSKTASTIGRQLSFAGIALIWIFKVDRGGQQSVPPDLVWPAVLIVAALSLDLLHYMIGTAIWGVYARLLEVNAARGSEMPAGAPRWFNWPSLFFFWGKMILVIVAFILILSHLARRVL